MEPATPSHAVTGRIGHLDITVLDPNHDLLQPAYRYTDGSLAHTLPVRRRGYGVEPLLFWE
ncbi:MAG: hypothetical protein JWM63_4736 [Gammaproteobacteria bacterium]|jgi:hypothetical protein|nr:hypothetical protein [Gammaproteobacteria bacterium]